MFEFASPKWLWLFLLIIPYLSYEIFFKAKRKVRLPFSRLKLLKEVSQRSSFLRFLPILIRVLVLSALVFSLARPRYAHKQQQITGKGIDIILAIDISGSMQAVDFRPKNRLEAAKKVANEFIQQRKNDRIGVIVFSDHAYTKCPLTLDYNVLMQVMDDIEIDPSGSGTAIGMGLATSAARMKESQAKSKVIILITDGRNNTGEIDPLTAADLAATYDIKVYTIGVGKKGYAEFPVTDPLFGTRYKKMKVDVDMETLTEIAKLTGTDRARRAHNTEELTAIISQINRLEKSEIKIKNYYEYEEKFHIFLLMAAILLLCEIAFRVIWLKELP